MDSLLKAYQKVENCIDCRLPESCHASFVLKNHMYFSAACILRRSISVVIVSLRPSVLLLHTVPPLGSLELRLQ